MQELLDQVLPYVRGVWSNRWVILIVSAVVSFAGFSSVLAMPNIYEAKARFYLDASSRLRDVVSALGMEPDVNSRVYLVRQAITSRPQLERVARATDLDLTVTTEEEKEALLNRMREKINISTGKGREGQNLYSVTYNDREQKVALNVVSAILDSFVEDVLEQKDTDTQRTRQFLADQLGYYLKLLEETEHKLQQFKREHPFFVIGAKGDYFARLQATQDNLQLLSAERQLIVGKRDELRRQLRNTNPYATAEDTATKTMAFAGSETSLQLANLKRQKRDLLLRYTDKHPQVIAVEEQIGIVQAQWERELRNAAKQAEGDGVSTATNPVYIDIQAALRTAILELTEIDGKIAQVTTKVNELRAEIDSAPILEGEYIKLTRDYDNYQRLYNEVLDKSERERIGRVGEESDVISFNVIDPPRVGSKPVSPNRPILLALVFAGSLALGTGVALGLWLLKPTIHSVSELTQIIPLPVLGGISDNHQGVAGRDNRSMLLFIGFLAALAAVCAVTIIAADPLSQLVQSLLSPNRASIG